LATNPIELCLDGLIKNFATPVTSACKQSDPVCGEGLLTIPHRAERERQLTRRQTPFESVVYDDHRPWKLLCLKMFQPS
jgi:hypothetical protein